MSRPSFRKDPQLVRLVNSCAKRRLSYKEAVSVIRGYGYPISEKTYQRMKSEVEEDGRERFDHLSDMELRDFTIDSIDTARAVESELWDIVRTAKTHWEKMKALQMIMENRKTTESFYDSSSVVAEFSKKLKEAKSDNKDSNLTKTESDKNDPNSPSRNKENEDV